MLQLFLLQKGPMSQNIYMLVTFDFDMNDDLDNYRIIRYRISNKMTLCLAKQQKTQHINIIHKAVYLFACLQHNGPVVVCYPKHRNIIMHSTLVVEHFIMLTALMPVHPSLRKLVFKGFIIKDKG